MSEAGWSGFHCAAPLMQNGFDIVQIEHRALANSRELLPVRGAPEMFHYADGVTASLGGLFQLCAKSGEPVDQRRGGARDAHGIAQGARSQRPAVDREVDHEYTAR